MRVLLEGRDGFCSKNTFISAPLSQWNVRLRGPVSISSAISARSEFLRQLQTTTSSCCLPHRKTKTERGGGLRPHELNAGHAEDFFSFSMCFFYIQNVFNKSESSSVVSNHSNLKRGTSRQPNTYNVSPTLPRPPFPSIIKLAVTFFCVPLSFEFFDSVSSRGEVRKSLERCECLNAFRRRAFDEVEPSPALRIHLIYPPAMKMVRNASACASDCRATQFVTPSSPRVS